MIGEEKSRDGVLLCENDLLPATSAGANEARSHTCYYKPCILDGNFLFWGLAQREVPARASTPRGAASRGGAAASIDAWIPAAPGGMRIVPPNMRSYNLNIQADIGPGVVTLYDYDLKIEMLLTIGLVLLYIKNSHKN